METTLFLFFLSFGFSLFLTPLVTKIAKRYNLVDSPSGRKIHKEPIPRIGGIALFMSFFLSVALFLFFSTKIFTQIQAEYDIKWIFAGSMVVFLMGLADDILRLSPKIKIIIQVLAAVLAFQGGLMISNMQLPWSPSYSFGYFSLPVTIFWFLLVINAINLIDGLDGLAAGVSLFVSLTLWALCLMNQYYLNAVGLAALAGVCLGFLRYNFNPATIFMGDSGSYFLGYMLAALSLMGSMKSQATVAILIPVIALGLPLMDAILSPIRRFIIGNGIFHPDKSHIHHKLLQKGLSHRIAVLWMYGITIFLGCFALAIVNLRDMRAGIILTVLGISIIVGIRKLGYLEYFAVDKVIGYFRDVSDEMGLQKERRTFLNRQVSIMEAENTKEMWERVTDALTLLKFDWAEIKFNGVRFNISPQSTYKWCNDQFNCNPDESEHQVMSIELPLARATQTFGTLYLMKDIIRDPLCHYTLRRIEHLRRTIVSKLDQFEASVPNPPNVIQLDPKQKNEAPALTITPPRQETKYKDQNPV